MVDPRDHELAEELRTLGRQLQVPTPDLARAVRARLEQRQPRTRLVAVAPRRWLAAAAAIVLALAIALVPQSRAAVAHTVTGLLRFAGIEVRHARPTPAATPSPLPGIRVVSLEEARRLAHFTIRTPDRLGTLGWVEVIDPGPDGAPRIVSLFYRGGAVRLDEFDGRLDFAFLKTSMTEETRWLNLTGVDGLWFPDPHSVAYIDRQGNARQETSRLAGSTLIWTDNVVTYRLEGPLTFDEAAAIAGTVH